MSRMTIILTIVLLATGCTTTGKPVYKITARPVGERFEFEFSVGYEGERHQCTER